MIPYLDGRWTNLSDAGTMSVSVKLLKLDYNFMQNNNVCEKCVSVCDRLNHIPF